MQQACDRALVQLHPSHLGSQWCSRSQSWCAAGCMRNSAVFEIQLLEHNCLFSIYAWEEKESKAWPCHLHAFDVHVTELPGEYEEGLMLKIDVVASWNSTRVKYAVSIFKQLSTYTLCLKSWAGFFLQASVFASKVILNQCLSVSHMWAASEVLESTGVQISDCFTLAFRLNNVLARCQRVIVKRVCAWWARYTSDPGCIPSSHKVSPRSVQGLLQPWSG